MINIPHLAEDVNPELPDWLVVPLIPGTKVAKGGWSRKRQAAGTATIMPLTELMRRREEFAPFDVGVLLRENDLVLIDADVSLAAISTSDTSYSFEQVDGRANFRAWLEDTRVSAPETWHDISPGDPGRHDRGEHWLFKRNPRVQFPGRHFWLAPNVEVKLSGIVRLSFVKGSETEVVTGGEPAEMPDGLALAIAAGKVKRSNDCTSSTGVGSGQEPELFALAGKLMRDGKPRDLAYEEYREVARSFTETDPSWPWDEAAIGERFEHHWQWHEDNPSEIPVSEPWMLAWASRQEAVTASPVKPHGNWAPPDLSVLSGQERLDRFDELRRLESDSHYLARDWKDERELQQKYADELLIRARLTNLKVDDEWFTARFSAEEIESLCNKHKRISRVGDEVHILDLIPASEARWKGEGDEGEERIGHRGRDAVLAVELLAASQLVGLSDRQVAYIINNNQELFGVAGCRWITRERVGQIRRELKAEGLLTEILKGHAYLSNHRRDYCPQVHEANSLLLEEVAERLGWASAEVSTLTSDGKGGNFLDEIVKRILKGQVRPSHKLYWRRALGKRSLVGQWSRQRADART